MSTSVIVVLTAAAVMLLALLISLYLIVRPGLHYRFAYWWFGWGITCSVLGGSTVLMAASLAWAVGLG